MEQITEEEYRSAMLVLQMNQFALLHSIAVATPNIDRGYLDRLRKNVIEDLADFSPTVAEMLTGDRRR